MDKCVYKIQFEFEFEFMCNQTCQMFDITFHSNNVTKREWFANDWFF